MMKLLFKPTGNIFTLPDEEALKIKQSDRGNYEILEAGIIELSKPEQVSQKKVKELVETRATIIKNEKEFEQKQEAKAAKSKTKRVNPNFKKYDANLETMGKPELEVFAAKLGITDAHNKTKPELIARIKKLKGE